MKYDDGFGPYDYCKRGLSHCDDQLCGCVDTAGYRAMYQRSRERRGWNGYHHPGRSVQHLAIIAVLCMSAGLLLAAAIISFTEWFK